LADDRGDLTRLEPVEQTGLEVSKDRLQSASDTRIAVLSHLPQAEFSAERSHCLR
jgi:hypothetical protein